MKTKIKILLKIAISAALLAWVLRVTNIPDAISALRELDIAIFLLAFFFYYVGSITFNSAITLKASGMAINYLMLMDKVNIVMRACTLFLPAYVVSALRWKFYTKIGLSTVNAFFLMLINRSHQILSSCFVILVALSAGISSNAILEVFWPMSIFGLFCAAFGMLVALNTMGLRNGVFSFFNQTKMARLRFYNYIAEVLPTNRKGTIAEFLIIIILSLVSAMVIVFALYMLINQFLPVDLLHLFLARSVVQLLLVAPITIAGIGVREAGFVGILSMFGYPTDPILTFAIALLLFQCILFGFGLLVYWMDKAAFSLSRN